MELGFGTQTNVGHHTMPGDDAVRISTLLEYAAMNKLVAIAVLSAMLGLGEIASAQIYSPVVGGFDQLTNTITYRPNVVTAYSPAVTYAAPAVGPACGCAAPVAAPVTTYSPVTAYSPVTTAYAPVTAYSPVQPVVAYSPVPVTSYLPMTAYSPVVSYSPVYAAPVAYPVYYRPGLFGRLRPVW
jgi:hypothetical protein